MNPIVFVILAAVLIGVAFYLVALPLIQQARRATPAAAVSSEQERLDELLAQRDAAFQAHPRAELRPSGRQDHR